jgi:uncharacterized protein CbrC (UPF0167 family)
MSESLPVFRHYPDPVSDETFRRSHAVCSACERARGWIAQSILYSATKPDETQVCPWCIADGTAAARWDGTFNEVEPGVSPERADVVERRTPNFPTWQDWAWAAHCGEPAVYLGQPRAGELRRYPDACDDLRAQVRDYDWPSEQVEELIDTMDPEGSAVAYLFHCSVCDTHLARWDLD